MTSEVLHPDATFTGLSVFDAKFWELLNYLAGIGYRIERMQLGAGIGGTNNPAGISLWVPEQADPVLEVFPAKLTDNLRDEAPGKYSYVELMPSGSGGWINKTAGAVYGALNATLRSGICWEFNLRDDIDVPVQVLMVVKYDEDHNPHYRFEFCCPEGSASSSGSSSGSVGGGGGAGFSGTVVGRIRCVDCPDVPGCKKYQQRIDTYVDNALVGSVWMDADGGNCCFEPCPVSSSSGSSSASSASSSSGSSSSSSSGATACKYVPCDPESGLPDLFFDPSITWLPDFMEYAQ